MDWPKSAQSENFYLNLWGIVAHLGVGFVLLWIMKGEDFLMLGPFEQGIFSVVVSISYFTFVRVIYGLFISDSSKAYYSAAFNNVLVTSFLIVSIFIREFYNRGASYENKDLIVFFLIIVPALYLIYVKRTWNQTPDEKETHNLDDELVSLLKKYKDNV
jgi:hypothetical protein